MMRELNRAAGLAGSDRPSNFRDRRSSMSQSQRGTLDRGRNSSDGEGRAERSHLKKESKKGGQGGSRRHNSPEDIDERRRKNKRVLHQSSDDDDDRHKSDASSTNACSRSEKYHIHRRTKNSDGEDKFRVIRLVNYRFKTSVDY